MTSRGSSITKHFNKSNLEHTTSQSTSWASRHGIGLAFPSAISGLAVALTFPNYSWSLLAWVAVSPFLMALGRAQRLREVIWTTLVFGFFYFYFSLWWLNTLTIFNPFIPLGIVLLGVALSGYLVAFSVPAWFVMRRLSAQWIPLVLATLWVAVEYLRGLGPFGFPWNYLGHSQLPTFPKLAQCADIAGVYGISWLIVFANALFATAALCRWKEIKWTTVARQLALPLAALLVVLYCVIRIYPDHALLKVEAMRQSDAEGTIRIAVLQPNISQLEKVGYYSATSEEEALAAEQQMTSTTLRLLEETSGSQAKLIVMPESSFNSTYFVYQKELHETLARYARALDADILFGADRRETQSDYAARLRHPFTGHSERSFPNLVVRSMEGQPVLLEEPEETVPTVAAFLVRREEGLTSTVYDKIHLVPFGETAPIFDRIPFFQEYILMVGTYARGTEYTIFQSDRARVGVMICFESTFASLARAYAQRKANLLCVITNDGWYDPTYVGEHSRFGRWVFSLHFLRTLVASGPAQHFYHSVFRAIETRTPVIRAANTGISAIILPSGEIVRQLGWHERGTFWHDVTLLRSHTTWYARFGDWLALGCVAIWAGVLCAGVVTALRHRRLARAATGEGHANSRAQ